MQRRRTLRKVFRAPGVVGRTPINVGIKLQRVKSASGLVETVTGSGSGLREPMVTHASLPEAQTGRVQWNVTNVN